MLAAASVSKALKLFAKPYLSLGSDFKVFNPCVSGWGAFNGLWSASSSCFMALAVMCA